MLQNLSSAAVMIGALRVKTADFAFASIVDQSESTHILRDSLICGTTYFNQGTSFST